MNIAQLYHQRCKPEGDFPDIWQHLPTLAFYAERVRHITEIGTRTGNSTVGFLYGLCVGGGCMVSYDIAPQEFFPPHIPDVVWQFRRENSQADSFRISPTELLFIDGDHSYLAVKQDLRQAQYALRYLIMHDTDPAHDERFGDGVVPAMQEFLAEHPEWKIVERSNECNGLTVMKRVG